jgi:hypothetical protein
MPLILATKGKIEYYLASDTSLGVGGGDEL